MIKIQTYFPVFILSFTVLPKKITKIGWGAKYWGLYAMSVKQMKILLLQSSRKWEGGSSKNFENEGTEVSMQMKTGS